MSSTAQGAVVSRRRPPSPVSSRFGALQALALSLLLACLVTLVAAAPAAEAKAKAKAKQAAVSLRIQVSDGQGTTVKGRLTCRGRRAVKRGFMTGRPARLCRTARRVRRLLVSRPRSGGRCKKRAGGRQTARVWGRVGGRRVNRRFRRTTRCAIADWKKASPLFAGALKPKARGLPAKPRGPGSLGALGGPPGGIPASGPGDDAVVIAVLDFQFTPYHWDFLASKMPQHQDGDPANDVPLDRPPHTWLRGFPDPGQAFASYEALPLTLEQHDENTSWRDLDAADKAKWDAVKPSTEASVNYYWLPGTKVIGAIAVGASSRIHGPTSAHGTGTTSVSVGNLYGACPECLLLFMDLSGASREESEKAIDWAMRQPWIDAITNSYGFSATPARDRVYSGSNTELQRQATERGQTVFFSSGNGVDGAFVLSNSTLFSSQEGPDWIVTVGAISPRTHGSYNSGKPADVAGIGSGYPAAYGSSTVTGSGRFGGTSNATPTLAGTYGRTLYRVRGALAGPSRVQDGGVIAEGAFTCGSARPDCELADGSLTGAELRRRLFMGAVHTAAGSTDPTGNATAPPTGEDEFLSEGHGSYTVLEQGRGVFEQELERIAGPLYGRAPEAERPEGERDWFIVDSFCRQHLWGSWGGGYYVEGQTQLPGPDPRWPTRSSMERSCPQYQPPP